VPIKRHITEGVELRNIDKVLSIRECYEASAVGQAANLSARPHSVLRMTRPTDRPARQGFFLAFEGGDGAGKSTQVRILVSWLKLKGLDVVVTHEPGDSSIGKPIREVVLDPANTGLSVRAEALLYAADRAEHVHSVIKPALARGAIVVTDRYVDSSIAYQGAGRGLGVDAVRELSAFATDGLLPHLTVLLDVPVGVARQRYDTVDRLEREPGEFHERVRQAFLDLAAAEPKRYLVVDGTRPLEDIAGYIRSVVGPLVGASRPHSIVTQAAG
jgi:dTMP kinase